MDVYKEIEFNNINRIKEYLDWIQSDYSETKDIIRITQIGSDIKYYKGSPLHYAVSEDKSEILKLLINHPVLKDIININIKNSNGESPLNVGCSLGSLESVKLLLQHPDIDINSKDKSLATPLYCCVYFYLHDDPSQNHYKIAKLLLQQSDIDVNIKDIEGYTPLYLAILLSRNKMIELLLTHPDTDVNAKHKEYKSCLEEAIYNNNMEAIKMLINHPRINLTSISYNKYRLLKNLEVRLYVKANLLQKSPMKKILNSIQE